MRPEPRHQFFSFPILVILCCFMGQSHGGSTYPRFRHLGLKQGLSQSFVNTIVQDHRGYMWFGTQDGLNVFDGYEIQVFRHNEERPHSLTNNMILSLFEDDQQRLWVGTRQGLNRFHHETRTFSRYLTRTQKPGSAMIGPVNNIRQDAEGNLWVVASERLLRFKPETGEFQAPVGAATGPAKIEFLGPVQNGLCWIGSREGLWRFDVSEGTFTRPKIPLNDHYITTVLQRRGRNGETLWLGLDERGLLRVDPTSGEIKHFSNQGDVRGSLPGGRVSALLCDNENQLWVGTRRGLARWNPHHQNFDVFQHLDTLPQSISGNHRVTLFRDSGGILWTGGSGGVSFYNPSSARFGHYLHIPGNDDSLTHSDVETAFFDHGDVPWVSTYNSTLHRYNAAEDRFEIIDLDRDGFRFQEFGVSVIREKEPGLLYLAGRGAGLASYEVSSGAMTQLLPNEQSQETFVNALLLQGDLTWIGTFGNGLLKRDESGNFSSFRHDPEDPTSLSEDTIWALSAQGDEVVWVGSYGGLSRLRSDTGKFHTYRHKIGDPHSLSNDAVGSLAWSAAGDLWVGTDGGINRFVPESETFVHYTSEDGLPNDVIYAILPDNQGFLWLATNKGLSRFNLTTEEFENFVEEDGLQGDEFNSGAAARGADGTLMFGGLNGLNMFQPQTLGPLSGKPRMVFTQFRLFNEPVTPDPAGGEPLLKHLDFTEELTLTHQQNVCSIHFAGLDYAAPHQHRYAYKLEGFQKDWIFTDAANRYAQFTNLNPHEYLFRVKCVNRDGVWSKDRRLKLRILPAPWKSPWAYTVYALLGLSLLFAYGLTSRRMRARLEQNVAARTAELFSKNQELDVRYHELEALDDIVSTINREVELDKLLNVLLEQARILIPSGEKGSFLLYDEDRHQYRIFATLGYRLAEMSAFVFDFQALRRRYFEGSEQLSEGIRMVRPGVDHPGQEKAANLPVPRSLLIMEITLDGSLKGLLVLDNFCDDNAFVSLDPKTLSRFRNHAISAVAKASAFQSLQVMNREILNKQNQLVTQEKMASLGTLTAGVAHELKNPLNFINGLSQVTLELLREYGDAAPTPKTAEDLLRDVTRNTAIVHKNGVRANTIVESMMALSRRDSGSSELVPINTLVAETLQLVYNGARVGRLPFEITIVHEFDEKLGLVKVVPQSLQRVLINLFNNALDSLKEKMNLCRDFEPELRVGTGHMGKRFDIFVRDNGTGISPEDRPRIFDHFFTTRSPDEGNIGLGLPISYDIIKQEHQGHIRVESEPGAYAMFTVSIPER